jgi:molybdopterin converting factor small subunit
MPKVTLMGSIRQYAGGLGTVEVEGATARAAIASLERAQPALKGWAVDEQGALRRHVKLFVGGAAVTLDRELASGDELFIVGAISGG